MSTPLTKKREKMGNIMKTDLLETNFKDDELPIGLLQAILFNDKDSEYFEHYPYMSAVQKVDDGTSFQFTVVIQHLFAENIKLQDILTKELQKQLQAELRTELQAELKNLQDHLVSLNTLTTQNQIQQYTAVASHMTALNAARGGKQRKQRGGNDILKKILFYKRKSNIIAPAPHTPVTQFSSIQQVVHVNVTQPQTAATTRTVYANDIPVVVTQEEYETILASALDTFKLTKVSVKDSDESGKVAIVTFTATEAILKMLDEKCVELWESYTETEKTAITEKVKSQEPDISSENIKVKIQELLFIIVYETYKIPRAYHTMLLQRKIDLKHLAIANRGTEGQTAHFKIKDYYRHTKNKEFKDSDFMMTIEILFALLEHGYALHGKELTSGQVGFAAKEILAILASPDNQHEISKALTGEHKKTINDRLTSLQKHIVFYMDEPLLLKIEKALIEDWSFLMAQVPYHINDQTYFLTLVECGSGVNQLHTMRSLFPKDLTWRENLIIMYDVDNVEVFEKQERTSLIRYNGVTTYLRPIYRGGHNHFRISLIDDRITVGHKITSKHFALLNTTLKKCFTVEKLTAPRFGGIIRPYNDAMNGRAEGGSRLKSRRPRSSVTKVIIS